MKKQSVRLAWKTSVLIPAADAWFAQQRRKTDHWASETSPWWSFVYDWKKNRSARIQAFVDGTYRFRALQQYDFSTKDRKKDTVQSWTYEDRCILRLFWKIIAPVARKIISPHCYHLAGPSGVQKALRNVDAAIQTGRYKYCIRTDIKGYYASINRSILLKQTQEHFQDPRTRNYLEQIITIPIIKDASIFTPTTGIPIRSTLSPFLAALYLSPVDKAFEHVPGVFYARYCDDIIILTRTRRQYDRARHQLAKHIAALRLRISQHKTIMGVFKHFHFLGITFRSQNREGKTHVVAEAHSRTSARALDKVKLHQSLAVHPASVQNYLSNWATWWGKSINTLTTNHYLVAFTIHTRDRDPPAAALARGLLPWPVWRDSICATGSLS